MSEKRPEGGHRFEAVRTSPEGWTVMGPWIQTQDGEWYRPHIEGPGGWGERSKSFATHVAEGINAAMERTIPFLCPACDSELGEMCEGAIFPSPTAPSIRCLGCGTKFMIRAFPLEEE